MPLFHLFVNLLGSQLRLQHETPRPHWLLGPWMLHRLHLQCLSCKRGSEMVRSWLLSMRADRFRGLKPTGSG